MTAPKSTIWDAEPHTLAKHRILKHYLGAWFPILARGYNRVVYYDGFAGPGRYSKGEEGSPILALKVARDHAAPLSAELVFVFVERDAPRATHLRDVEIPALALPTKFHCQVHNTEFEVALSQTLDYLDKKKLTIAPTFAFIDPFGVTGVGFDLIKRLLGRPHCEVLITFMNSTIQRFVSELPNQTNALIGNLVAAEELAACPGDERLVLARQMYEASLRQVARFVRFFEMRNAKNVPIYDLFFASNSEIGHVKMKEAMWKVDAGGSYRFSDGADPAQATLFSPTPEQDLAPSLWKHFRGRVVLSQEVRRYTRDETAYLEKHARAALILLEDGEVSVGTIEVAPLKEDGTRRRRHSFPDGVRIIFQA